MSAVGEKEKKTQARVVALFRDSLGTATWVTGPIVRATPT